MNTENQVKGSDTFGIKEVLFLIVITCIVALMIGYMLGCKNNNSKKYDSTLNEIIANYEKIVSEFEGDIDKNKILTGAINGMLSTLNDEHSSIINDSYSDNFYKYLNGSYEGVGIEITNDDNNNILVVGTLSNSPAEAAGILKGDIIKSIDGNSMLNKDKSELTSYIKSNLKDYYKIIVDRDGEEKTFTLKREVVSIKSVSFKIIERENKKIGYIYISIFANATIKQFKNALDELSKNNIDGLVIDVRENSGGHLTTAVGMLSYLLSSDKVIYQTEKDGKTTLYYSKGSEDYKLPIVIVQNSNSASASELFTAALKEQLNAYVVGDTSYGKGTIQEINYLSNGETYKFTTKKWKTPNGAWIDGKGIKPDKEVSLDTTYIENPSEENDNQLNEALNYLIGQ